MADGVLLLVDAFEGPMPQTRFVLEKAILMNKKPIVVVNKVDKPNCNPENANELVFDLMYSLGATEDQLDFPTVYGSAKNGWMSDSHLNETSDISYLMDTIIERVPAPKVEEGNLQMMITSLDYSSYTGRIAIGRILRGTIKTGMDISLVKRNGTIIKSKIKELYVFEGLGKERIKFEIGAGEICALLGPEDFEIGDTIADFENPEQLTPISIDEPTMSMLFTINNSPFFGKSGKYVTSRHIRDRLIKETQQNLALKVIESNSPDSHIVYGRGILHLSILIENMRREGYELQVGQPKVIIKEINGAKLEPIEELTVNLPTEMSGKIIEIVTSRKGEIISINNKNDRATLLFKIASRGLIGLQNIALTLTEGEAVLTHRFVGFEPYRGDITKRRNGALIAMETGTAIAYSINRLQDRGIFFIVPGTPVYAGQVIGENTRQEDIVINVTHTKKLTNMRASGSDDKVIIAPPKQFSLEDYLEYIADDEYLEITPDALRIRKILLSEHDRKKMQKSISIS